ncbi:hypothetical protein V5799_016024 [Amblyomma americanum]|uniref:Carboxylesterase type B domain-containing protein n=1 Tax=Amblyomma americanum TaxID=6943 RepID=A0AAQ4F6B3_AMBAM
MYSPLDEDEFLPFSVLTPETWQKINVRQVLLGTTANEATMFLGVMQEAFHQVMGMMKTEYRMLCIIVMAQALSIPVSQSKKIVRAYFGDDSQEHSFEQVQDILARMLGDAVFDCPAQLFADSASRQGIKTYRYLFGYRPTHSLNDEWMGVAHGDDIVYALGSLPFIKDKSRYTEPMGKAGKELLASKNYTAGEEQFMKEIVATWASFIKSGKPVTPKPSAQWQEYGARNRYPVVVLKPHNYTTLEDDKRKRCDLWTPIFYRNEEKPTGTDTVVPNRKPTKQPGRKPVSKPKNSFSAKDRKMSSGIAKLPLACLLYAAIATTLLLW